MAMKFLNRFAFTLALPLGALILASSGCQSGGAGAGGGGGGARVSGSCRALLEESGDLAQEAFESPDQGVDMDLQCRLVNNQIDTIEAGCFDNLNSPPGFDVDLDEQLEAQLAGLRQQADDLGCED